MATYCLFRDNLDILMDTFYKEIEKLSDHALQVRINHLYLTKQNRQFLIKKRQIIFINSE